jgi:hypothetical protein
VSCSPRGCLGLRVGCWVTRGIQERASTEERGGGIGVHKFGGCDCSPPRSLIDLLEYRSVVCLDLRLVWPGLGETRSRGVREVWGGVDWRGKGRGVATASREGRRKFDLLDSCSILSVSCSYSLRTYVCLLLFDRPLGASSQHDSRGNHRSHTPGEKTLASRQARP